MIRIAFIVLAALGIFGAVFAYGRLVHSPFVAGLCRSECAKRNMSYTLNRQGYGRSASTGCTCLKKGAAGVEAKSAAGYFLVSSEFGDWFLMIWVRLIPMAVIIGVGVFLIAKVVPRLPGG